jgi:DNA-binding CsgD family transcriptional regulator
VAAARRIEIDRSHDLGRRKSVLVSVSPGVFESTLKRGGRGKALRRPLSPREREIAAAVASGRTNREIAALHGISVQTVKNHITSVFLKTGVSNRVQLALYFTARGRS